MDLTDKIIMVTGGTGFIGSYLVNRLINQGNHVSIITLSNEFDWRIKDKKKCKFFYIDLQNYSEVKKCIDKIKPEIIFHMAAYVNPEREINLIDKLISINYIGTKNILLSLDDYDYDLFINTGTSDEYGRADSPFKEIQREKPISPYSASKVATTYLCEMMASIYDKPIITIRPSLIYGPTQISNSLIPLLIYTGMFKKTLSLTPCKQTRDFLFIDDLVEACISLAVNAKKVKKLGIFNVGTGKETEILKIVNLIKNQFPDANFLIGDKPYRIGEAMSFYLSIDKIKSEIGWVSKWDIENGIKETVKWWLENQDLWMRHKNMLNKKFF